MSKVMTPEELYTLIESMPEGSLFGRKDLIDQVRDHIVSMPDFAAWEFASAVILLPAGQLGPDRPGAIKPDPHSVWAPEYDPAILEKLQHIRKLFPKLTQRYTNRYSNEALWWGE